MPDQIHLPNEVKKSITAHLKRSISRSVSGYLSGSEDEDTLTGALGENLRISKQTVNVKNPEIGGVWTWGVTYHKFRGRGYRATEKFVGADGIFELSVRGGGRPSTEKKSALFQAKNQWIGSDQGLVEESIKLSNWREAAFAINYTPSAYEAYFLDDIIRVRGSKSQAPQGILLADFLANYFLECLVGDKNLSYDGSARKLSWRTVKGQFVETEFSLGHKFAITVTRPRRKRSKRSSKKIKNEEIHNYRMGVSETDLLSLTGNFTSRDVTKGRNKLALAYHPDNYQGSDPLLQEIMKKRMQEANNARDVLNANIKRD